MKKLDKQTVILCLSFVGLVGLGGCGRMGNAYITWWVLMGINIAILFISIIALIICALAKAKSAVLFFQTVLAWTAIIFMVGLGICGASTALELLLAK